MKAENTGLVAVEVEERRFELSQRQMKPFMGTAMIPAYLRDIGSLMILDTVAKRYKMDLLFLAQEMYIVKGKFAISGKMAIAFINKSGVLDGRLKFEVTKNPFSVRAYGTIDGDVVYGMAIDDALIKANNWERNPLWIAQKELMARYRSATYFARMEMPEVLMGFHTDDELEDITDTPKDQHQITGTINQVVQHEDGQEAPKEEQVIDVLDEEEQVVECTKDHQQSAPLDTTGAEEVANHAPEKPKRAVKAVTAQYELMESVGIKRGHLAQIVRYFDLTESNIVKFTESIREFRDEFYSAHDGLKPNEDAPRYLEDGNGEETPTEETAGTIVASSAINAVAEEKEVVVDPDEYVVPNDVAVEYSTFMMAGLKRADLVEFVKFYKITARGIESFLKDLDSKIANFYEQRTPFDA